ncbi:PREDICTED: putative 1-phosphatidylinositol-3-phosphate 5-kinase FAB1D isoform X1 [Camelina sativa]|uniref:1-phosphatidylinositol-3-phosphate 5-kinase n=3 Tax=Camelina sativa TaxID=90675 RepID=A0ABM0YF26_CAMSA|nr:PREDICTED: putative 1-phosphatidylinositol-3-phosphate 5-kinase FAB1D isoform X1 [Camelina sativa]
MTPSNSLSSSSERSLSGESSVDGNTYDRGNEDECSSHSSQEDVECTTEHKVERLERKSKSMPSDILNILDEKAKEDGVENVQFLSDREDDSDVPFWEPPEPENPEDEEDGVFADDDDDCCDGSEWSKASLLGDSKDESSEKRDFYEETRRVMLEEAHSKFKFIVRQLIKSAGFSMEEGEYWLEIVARLCWEAASLLKPAIDGKAVDPTEYIKVKCIATGSFNDSQVFKGLVFKKHAALKHMATKYEHPKIMLVEGVLGHPISGFSSLQSVNQDEGYQVKYVKPVVDIIEATKPDVMLVEKSVSRDIQKSILDKGVTLVFDMKLHRLQRISRCIGSPIFSVDSLSGQKLKHCDSFRIEKIVEEHNAVGEAEKKPTKTLMFLEGCPTRLGCTILLKGCHSDRLKKVKEVVQYSFILAYHLMLEASFLADRYTMFSTIFTKEAASCVMQIEKFPLSPSPGESAFETVNIPLSNGFDEQSILINGDADGEKDENREPDGDHVFSHEPYNPVIFTGFSTLSAKLSKYLGFVQNQESVPVSVVTDVSNISNLDSISESVEDTAENDETKQAVSLDPEIPVNMSSDDGDRSQTENDIESTLESQSILVLVSKRNALRGIMCDQRHFSHIKFYKHFDVPLERFLRDMFNQKNLCQTCEGIPEAHLYYYAHNNKQLTIEVKRIPSTKCLSGEGKGKIWMWSRCGKCKPNNVSRRSTKRVLISTAARSLSFGKFLELSFSQQTFLNRSSSCGHSFDRDFLHFFGLGSMVAILSYSQVASYTVSLPPMKMVSSVLIKAGWLEKEFEGVFTKGISLFEDAGGFLKRLRSQFINSDPSYHCAHKLLSNIEELLDHERRVFEENIRNSFDKAKTIDDVSHRLLRLNRMRWELLLQALIWNYRLQSLVLSNRLRPSSDERKTCEQGVETVSEAGMTRYENDDKSSDSGSNGVMDTPIVEDKEIPIVGVSVGDNDQMEESNVPEDSDLQTLSSSMPEPETTSPINNHFDTHLAVSIHSTNEQEGDKSIPITGDSLDGEVAASTGPHILGWNEWFWLSFEELRSKRIVDVEKEYLLKFEYVNNFTQENLQTVNQIITEEGSRLRISLRDDDFIVSDYEDELSSLIACALAHLNIDENKLPLSRCIHGSLEGFLDKDQDSKQTADREASRFASESTNRLDIPPPEVLVTFGSLKSIGKPKYSIVSLYADDFRDLRRRCCSSELDYIASLSRCKPWDAKGGKSKSVFAKTLDDRFIVKEIKKTEYESFVTFAPEYFKYMKDSYDLGNQTCLAKVLGIHQVTVRQPKGGGKEIRHDLMVMENLSFGRKITRQYDLKGALHARFTTTSANGADDVLLDQNFVNDMNKSPLYVSKTSKQNLQRAVYNDTSFLTSINVMDYSLLVGVDDENHELVCGIIDYLRQYTWDKQLETWVKSSLVVPKNVQPTVISPIDYKTRFRKFMKTHFLCVPDQWCDQGDS